jgi:hypothetical protein
MADLHFVCVGQIYGRKTVWSKNIPQLASFCEEKRSMIVSQVVQHEYLEDLLCLQLSSLPCKQFLKMEIIYDLAKIKIREFYIL